MTLTNQIPKTILLIRLRHFVVKKEQASDYLKATKSLRNAGYS